jgi:Dullard-like phosphatase family protein
MTGASPPGPLAKLSVVLDLDETLVHASFTEPAVYDFKLAIPCAARPVTVYVQKRPGVEAFIRAVASEFDVFVFTASHIDYALPVVQQILPCFPPERVLWRCHCRLHAGFLVKDLAVFQRDLARMVIVDNLPQSFMLQPENGIPISTWTGDYDDAALMGALLPFLRCCAAVADVRSLISSCVQ